MNGEVVKLTSGLPPRNSHPALAIAYPNATQLAFPYGGFSFGLGLGTVDLEVRDSKQFGIVDRRVSPESHTRSFNRITASTLMSLKKKEPEGGWDSHSVVSMAVTFFLISKPSYGGICHNFRLSLGNLHMAVVCKGSAFPTSLYLTQRI